MHGYSTVERVRQEYRHEVLGEFVENGQRQHVYTYGLRRSSLIVGVHPGCPVCSIVAASLVAVETDVGETISTLACHSLDVRQTDLQITFR